MYTQKFAFSYLHRPNHEQVIYLSPYEFTMWWQPCLATYPVTVEMSEENTCHAVLTEAGRKKVQQRARGEEVDFKPGEDYCVEAREGSDWLAFPDTPATAAYRHEWVLQRHIRPKDPLFFGAPLPRKGDGEERTALLVMAYYHPYTAVAEFGTEHIPVLAQLRGEHQSWHDAMLAWFDGRVLCLEAKRYIDNFFAVTRAP
jgi:hypothetical protein